MSDHVYRKIITSCSEVKRTIDGVARQYKIAPEKAQAFLNRGINEGWLRKENKSYKQVDPCPYKRAV